MKRTAERYRKLRLKQLLRSSSVFESASKQPRPRGGWLQAIRDAVGMSAAEVSRALKITGRRIFEFEKAEARERITLHSLRKMGEAMGFDLVYGFVPRPGVPIDPAQRARAQATEDVQDVEHMMRLENQAAGDLEELIEDETREREGE